MGLVSSHVTVDDDLKMKPAEENRAPLGGCATDPRVVRTQQVVRAAVLHILIESGFAGLNIDAVSRRSGVSRTTIYRHWPTAGALAADAVTSMQHVNEEVDTGSIVGDMRANLMALVEKMQTPWGNILPTLIDASFRADEVRDLYRTVVSERRAYSIMMVKRASDRGELPKDVDAVTLVDRLVGPMFYRHLVMHEPVDKLYVDRLLQAEFRPYGLL